MIAASYLAALPWSPFPGNRINPVFSCSEEVWGMHVLVSAVWTSHSAPGSYSLEKHSQPEAKLFLSGEKSAAAAALALSIHRITDCNH